MFIVRAFEQGGIFMYFILTFAILTLAFITERFLKLYVQTKPVSPDFRKNLLDCIQNNDLAAGERLARQQAKENPAARIAEVGFRLRADAVGDEELQARMDEQLSTEIAAIDQRTGFLAMFGNVATLVGLLGTIGGMIVAFAGVADANPAERASLLSKGISHALNCTAFGLLVAIPALVFFAVLQNRADHLIKGLVAQTTEIYHDLLFLTESNTTSPVAEKEVRSNRSSKTNEVRV
jgi:biopolymer transport protein ExbB